MEARRRKMELGGVSLLLFWFRDKKTKKRTRKKQRFCRPISSFTSFLIPISRPFGKNNFGIFLVTEKHEIMKLRIVGNTYMISYE